MPLPQEDYTHTHTDTVYALSVFLSLSLSGYHSDYRLNLQVITGIWSLPSHFVTEQYERINVCIVVERWRKDFS